MFFFFFMQISHPSTVVPSLSSQGRAGCNDTKFRLSAEYLSSTDSPWEAYTAARNAFLANMKQGTEAGLYFCGFTEIQVIIQFVEQMMWITVQWSVWHFL
jgi:hypothetical protein